MATKTKAERQKEAERAREMLREWVTDSTVIYTHTNYGSGQTDYVRVYVATAANEITDLTYYVARAAGRRLTDRGIAYGGGGYSKGLEAAEDCTRAAGFPLNQHRWRTL